MNPENDADGADKGDVGRMASTVVATTMRLHGITSRTDAAQIVAEVLRLNDAVRAASHGRLRSDDHPQDFAALLLAASDPANTDAAA